MTNSIHSLWKKVDRRGEDECWPWTGKWKASAGYGRMDVGNVKGVYANRIAYLTTNPGSISLKADDVFVLHKCDNPKCCNPKHLFLGTHRDNMQDKVKKGRAPVFKGDKGPRAKLTMEQATELRFLASCNLSSGELAKVFKISKPSAKAIIAGRSYQP